MSSSPIGPSTLLSNSVSHSKLWIIRTQGCPRNQPKKSRPEIPENAAPVTENQIGNQLKVNVDPLAGTSPRAIQSISKQSAPIAEATHMVIVEELSRR